MTTSKSMYFSQIDVFSALTQGLDNLAPGLTLQTEKMNELLKISSEIAELLNRPELPPSKAGAGIEDWLNSADVGSSSKYLLSILKPELGLCVQYSHPHDLSDFCRCLKLLRSDPSLTQLLPQISSKSAQWEGLVESWSDIVFALENEAPNWSEGIGRSPIASNLLKKILNERN